MLDTLWAQKNAACNILYLGIGGFRPGCVLKPKLDLITQAPE